MSGAKKFLAFDIGGTKIAHALTDSRGCLLEEPQRNATPRDNDEIFRLLQEIVRRYEAEIDGVAIATAGEADFGGLSRRWEICPKAIWIRFLKSLHLNRYMLRMMPMRHYGANIAAVRQKAAET